MSKKHRRATDRSTLSAMEVAKLLKVSRKTITNYLERGWLQGVKKGFGPTSNWMIYTDSVQKFLERREQEFLKK